MIHIVEAETRSLEIGTRSGYPILEMVAMSATLKSTPGVALTGPDGMP
jgi:hypothetical protein